MITPTSAAHDDSALTHLTQARSPRVNWMDHAASWASSWASSWTPARAPRCGAGMGDEEVIKRLGARFAQPPAPPRELGVRWSTLPYTTRGVTRMRGFFGSPAQALPLPAASRAVYVELLLPEGASPMERPPVCVLLGADGEEGFTWRERFARGLIEHGVGALVVESPYHGLRRPRGRRVALATLADYMVMEVAAVEETRALLSWLRQSGFRHVGVSGFGRGGFVAAAAASSWPEPMAAVPIATGCSPAPALTSRAMGPAVDWAALRGQREAVAQALELLSVRRLGRPTLREAALPLGAKADAVCQPSCVLDLADWWDVPARWVPGGHASAPWLSWRAMHEAILDAFGVLLASEGRACARRAAQVS